MINDILVRYKAPRGRVKNSSHFLWQGYNLTLWNKVGQLKVEMQLSPTRLTQSGRRRCESGRERKSPSFRKSWSPCSLNGGLGTRHLSTLIPIFSIKCSFNCQGNLPLIASFCWHPSTRQQQGLSVVLVHHLAPVALPAGYLQRHKIMANLNTFNLRKKLRSGTAIHKVSYRAAFSSTRRTKQ
jgi:hypothetical protein